MLHKHMYEPLPPPRSRNPKVTDACSHLIKVMMAKEPAGRYGDWRALIADIDRALQGKAPAAHHSGAGASVAMPALSRAGAPASAVVSKADLARQAQQALARQQRAPPKPTVPPAGATTNSRPSWLTIGLVAAGAVVLALGGVIVASRHGRSAASVPGTAAAPVATASAKPASPAVPAFVRSAPPGLPVLGQPWTVPDLGLELVWVAPGGFQMGSAEYPPVHAVRISRGYWIGKYEVTQAEYGAIMGGSPSTFKGARDPVGAVSWSDALTFCTKLTERERKAGRLPEGYEYRLPTEAEWEYAARGGPKTQGYTYAGSDNLDEVAWCYVNSGDKRLDDSEADVKKRLSSISGNNCRTHPVGLKKANELGLNDMSGNVWEWCLDGYEGDYYARSPATDPVNLRAGSDRVDRGGSWFDGAELCRSANRRSASPGRRADDLGFRVVAAPAVP